MANPDLATGDIEVRASELGILNESVTPPFVIEDDVRATEEMRLRYRYLDLRRSTMQRGIVLRHEVCQAIRRYLSARDFVEIETPILTKTTPEGARDFLVPSRIHPGKFYCLAQSPQIYKQLLMVAGFDRYFQLARCLRDEDMRADRQPEHTQIDIEMSFVDEDDVITMAEELFRFVFAETLNVELPRVFPRIPYSEAMLRFGTDKPDTRFELEIVELSDIEARSGFGIFDNVLGAGGVVRAINVKGAGNTPRSVLDRYEDRVKEHGAGGLVWLKRKGEEITGPAAKFLDGDWTAEMGKRVEAESDDLILFVAGERPAVERSLGVLRGTLGKELGLIPDGLFQFCWITEFPLFERDEETGSWSATHHMFSMPRWEDMDLLETAPGQVRGQLYDLVCNGTELASGSIRVHRRDIQERIMKVVGISAEDAERKYGYLLEAFDHGAPPHGGIAPGIDRLIMLMAGKSTIRDVISFPKTLTAAALLEGAPSEVADEQLRDLHIRLDTDSNERE
jgi:aspartyl-tRNA synthetase